ncbi:MAG: FkbM family methyltransferase, partial [Thermoproteota archaeon]|nr:FkbM family methyltransferase [Thermoproteota archaeon]
AELEVLKGSVETISRSKGIRLLIEIHNLSEGKNLYEEIMVFLKGFGFNTEFEKKYENGEKHVIMRKI